MSLVTDPTEDGDPDWEPRAAAEVAFEKVMAGVDTHLAATPAELTTTDALRWAGDRLVEMLAAFAELPVERLLGLDGRARVRGDGGAPADGGTPADGPRPQGEPISISATAGGLAEARIWVHQRGAPAEGSLRFVLTDLHSATADPLPGAAAAFDPPSLALPALAGASTVIRFRVPADALPGAYHGHVVGRGVAGAAVPVTVVIT